MTIRFEEWCKSLSKKQAHIDEAQGDSRACDGSCDGDDCGGRNREPENGERVLKAKPKTGEPAQDEVDA